MKPWQKCALSIAGLLLVWVGVAIAWMQGWVVSPLARTALTLLTIGWLLGSLARFVRIFPGRTLVWSMLLPALATAGAAFDPSLLSVALLIDAGLFVLALLDLLTLPTQGAFAVERETGRIVSLKQSHRLALTISNRSRRGQTVSVRDGAPHELQPDPDEFRLKLAPRSRATVHYHIRSVRRGAFTLRQTHLRTGSLLGMWQRLLDYPVQNVLHVYPDMKQLAEYALLARKNRLSLMGVRRTRRIGQDNEFERLRDYTPDDNFKHIDWRTTARRRKLTVKDFQANQSQRLIFLLDCGRMMTNEAAGLSLLDHSLNAMLMLSYVALSHGDSVGLLCFSDEIHGYVPPMSGMKQMNRLLHASFDRFPKLVESRYDQAFLYLAAHHRKRSLVILITNIIDEVNSNQVGQYLTSMVGRHLQRAPA